MLQAQLVQYIQPLTKAASPRQTVVDMLPHISILRRLQKERDALELRGAAIFKELNNRLYHGCMLRDEFDIKLQEYTSLSITLEEQAEPQDAALAELEASSTEFEVHNI